jgi:fluoroquinolone transport system ATP-binding protein
MSFEPDYAIDVKDLSFRYSEKEPDVLKNITFQIGKGEIFGFLGPSGAGKSTTQKILLGLLKNYRGSVKILGTEVSQMKRSQYQEFGVMFEFPTHSGILTAQENLEYTSSFYGLKPNREYIKELLKSVNLFDDADRKVMEFSKGMKNRLSFAKSLLHQPKLLFLDEPTSGLDPINASRIKDIIKEQKKKGYAVFLTTHDMLTAETVCDRIGFLVDGELKIIDSPNTLKLNYSQKKIRVQYTYDHSLIESLEFPHDELIKNHNFISFLDKKPNIQSIHSIEPTMEEIFIKITGKRLNHDTYE